MAGRTTDPEKLRLARKALASKNRARAQDNSYIAYPQPEPAEVNRAASVKACDMARGETHSEVLEEARLFLRMLGLL